MFVLSSLCLLLSPNRQRMVIVFRGYWIYTKHGYHAKLHARDIYFIESQVRRLILTMPGDKKVRLRVERPT
jgi:hypothetical protein